MQHRLSEKNTSYCMIRVAVTVLTASTFRSGVVGKSWLYVMDGILLYYIANRAYT
jgi:hypothetical protein